MDKNEKLELLYKKCQKLKDSWGGSDYVDYCKKIVPKLNKIKKEFNELTKDDFVLFHEFLELGYGSKLTIRFPIKDKPFYIEATLENEHLPKNYESLMPTSIVVHFDEFDADNFFPCCSDSILNQRQLMELKILPLDDKSIEEIIKDSTSFTKEIYEKELTQTLKFYTSTRNIFGGKDEIITKSKHYLKDALTGIEAVEIELLFLCEQQSLTSSNSNTPYSANFGNELLILQNKLIENIQYTNSLRDKLSLEKSLSKKETPIKISKKI